jgi:hypothetical protein
MEIGDRHRAGSFEAFTDDLHPTDPPSDEMRITATVARGAPGR